MITFSRWFHLVCLLSIQLGFAWPMIFVGDPVKHFVFLRLFLDIFALFTMFFVQPSLWSSRMTSLNNELGLSSAPWQGPECLFPSSQLHKRPRLNQNFLGPWNVVESLTLGAFSWLRQGHPLHSWPVILSSDCLISQRLTSLLFTTNPFMEYGFIWGHSLPPLMIHMSKKEGKNSTPSISTWWGEWCLTLLASLALHLTNTSKMTFAR